MRASEIIKKGVTEAQGQIQLGPQLFVSRQTTMEGIKPRAVAWTSTAQKTNQGFTSDWVEWCKDNMAQWVTDTGILYDVAPGARILLLRTDRDVIQVARRYGLEIKNSFDLFEKMDWDLLRKDYDAIHHIPQERDFFMSAWDVESAAWFDRKFLINPRKVKIDTGKTQNIEAIGKQGVSEKLNEFAVDGFNDGDNRSKLLGTVARLFKAGNKIDRKVPGQMGHVVQVKPDGVTMKKWGSPRSRIHYFLPMYDDSRDSKYTIKMVGPKHYAVVSAEKNLDQLDELFQGQKNWQWTFRGSEEVQAKFIISGIEYSYVAYEYKPGRWEIDFSNRSKNNKGKPYGITGTGNAAEVFGTVVDITRSFLQQYPYVDIISFSADEPSRQKLYAKMAQRLLPGWDMEKIGKNFYLTRGQV